MSPRDLFNRIMKYEPVDALPLLAFEPYETSGLARWREEGLPADATPQDVLGVRALNNAPVALGPVPGFEPTILSETEDEYLQIEWMGATVRRNRAQPDMYYGYIDHPVKCRADWEAYRRRFDADTPGRLPADLDALAAQLATSETPVGLMIFPFFFRLGFYSMGMERFMTAFHDMPDLMHDMFAWYGDFVLRTIKPLLGRVRLDYAAFGEDLAYRNGPHLSPKTYAEFWLPYQDPIVEALQAAGVPIICQYTAGNIEAYLPMLMDHGFNCTWPCERAAGMDPVALRREYGRDLRICGGMSKGALIAGPGAVDREIARLIPLIEEGGFVPAIDDMVPPEVPLATFRHYAEALGAVRL